LKGGDKLYSQTRGGTWPDKPSWIRVTRCMVSSRVKFRLTDDKLEKLAEASADTAATEAFYVTGF